MTLVRGDVAGSHKPAKVKLNHSLDTIWEDESNNERGDIVNAIVNQKGRKRSSVRWNEWLQSSWSTDS